MPVVADRESVHADLRKRFPGGLVTRKQLFDYRAETGIYAVWLRTEDAWRTDKRGVYKIPAAGEGGNAPVRVTRDNARKAVTAGVAPVELTTGESAAVPVAASADAVTSTSSDATSEDDDLPAALDPAMLKSLSVSQRLELIKRQSSMLARVPKVDPAFVAFGDFPMIRKVIASRRFVPIFITGLTGNGKTFGVEQGCAIEGREYIRVNITNETDEDDLIGGFRLVDGNTVFEVGPVVVAMLRGAVLLIDEIDYASAKIACIQSVLEGRTITIKKLGITITSSPGFTVFATANTKGRGDETGQYAGANILNEAFLERFAMTVEQQYPDIPTEKRILARTFQSLGYTMSDHARVFIDTLAKWANGIRKTYEAGGVDSVMSTRRLVHIINAYGLFGADPDGEAAEMALQYCINRFDTRTKDAFTDLWNKLAPDPGAPINVGSLDGEDITQPAF